MTLMMMMMLKTRTHLWHNNVNLMEEINWVEHHLSEKAVHPNV